MESPGKILFNAAGRNRGKYWWRGWVVTRRGHSGTSGIVKMFYFLIWVLAIWVYSFFVRITELYFTIYVISTYILFYS